MGGETSAAGGFPSAGIWRMRFAHAQRSKAQRDRRSSPKGFPDLRSQCVAEPVLKTGFPSQASGVGVPPVVAPGVRLAFNNNQQVIVQFKYVLA